MAAKEVALAQVRDFPRAEQPSLVRRASEGLGHAVLSHRQHISDKPLCMLGDDLIDTATLLTRIIEVAEPSAAALSR